MVPGPDTLFSGFVSSHSFSAPFLVFAFPKSEDVISLLMVLFKRRCSDTSWWGNILQTTSPLNVAHEISSVVWIYLIDQSGNGSKTSKVIEWTRSITQGFLLGQVVTPLIGAQWGVEWELLLKQDRSKEKTCYLQKKSLLCSLYVILSMWTCHPVLINLPL